jgi:hypothetical protein
LCVLQIKINRRSQFQNDQDRIKKIWPDSKFIATIAQWWHKNILTSRQ